MSIDWKILKKILQDKLNKTISIEKVTWLDDMIHISYSYKYCYLQYNLLVIEYKELSIIYKRDILIENVLG